MAIQAETLPPQKTLNGLFDAYCHVCWEPIYCLWVDRETDPAGKCAWGHTQATGCQEAMNRILDRVRIRAIIEEAKRQQSA